ncbi:hypothetical protein R5W60_05300 [Brucella pseudintermedia]|uniref:hypothetical protein n=1 Tax=Brucella pseudintermedia TaxID=370111 RepID=UPI00366FD7D9|nr:hypothetical protein R5W60_05300 [Brucella pseudintermedia]
MTKRLDVTKRQLKAVIQAADEEGKIAEIKIGNAFIRLVDTDYTDDKQIDDKGKGYL